MLWCALSYIGFVYGFLIYINVDLWRFFSIIDQEPSDESQQYYYPPR
ncbi:hypothetical protein [Herpetosiphon sp.]|nr:hypothetical protein [Herpetosiphon sp.]